MLKICKITKKCRKKIVRPFNSPGKEPERWLTRGRQVLQRVSFYFEKYRSDSNIHFSWKIAVNVFWQTQIFTSKMKNRLTIKKPRHTFLNFWEPLKSYSGTLRRKSNTRFILKNVRILLSFKNRRHDFLLFWQNRHFFCHSCNSSCYSCFEWLCLSEKIACYLKKAFVAIPSVSLEMKLENRNWATCPPCPGKFRTKDTRSKLFKEKNIWEEHLY